MKDDYGKGWGASGGIGEDSGLESSGSKGGSTQPADAGETSERQEPGAIEAGESGTNDDARPKTGPGVTDD